MFTEAFQRYRGVGGFPGPRNDGGSHATTRAPKTAPQSDLLEKRDQQAWLSPDMRPVSMKYAAYSLQFRAL
jgi:hypothetical protein